MKNFDKRVGCLKLEVSFFEKFHVSHLSTLHQDGWTTAPGGQEEGDQDFSVPQRGGGMVVGMKGRRRDRGGV